MTTVADSPKVKPSEQKTARRLILVTGDKGGTGKTTFSRGLLDVLIARGKTWAAYDGDCRNPQLHRHYQSVGEGVVRLDITAQGGADVLLDDMEQAAAEVMLVDLPAGAGAALESFVSETGFFSACQELNYGVTFVSVLSRVRDSVNALRILMQFSAGRANHVAVKNLHCGDPDKFRRFDGSKAQKTLLDRGGVLLAMPDLFDDTYDLVDEHSLSFRAAAGPESPLKRSHRSRVFQWLKSFELEAAKAGSFLGIDT